MNTILLEIYPPAPGYKKCAGTHVTDVGEIDFKRRFRTFWTFQGKTARVIVGTHHSGLFRNDALLFASDFVAGKIVTMALDLNTLTVTYS